MLQMRQIGSLLFLLIGASGVAGSPQVSVYLRAIGGDSEPMIEVSVRNAGASELLTMKRLVPDIAGEWPWWGVTIDAEGEDGRHFYSKRNVAAKILLPNACDLSRWVPGEFFGVRVSLTSGPFSVNVPKRGTYKVRVRIATDGRAWQLREGKRFPRSCPVEDYPLATTSLVSDPVAMVLGDRE